MAVNDKPWIRSSVYNKTATCKTTSVYEVQIASTIVQDRMRNDISAIGYHCRLHQVLQAFGAEAVRIVSALCFLIRLHNAFHTPASVAFLQLRRFCWIHCNILSTPRTFCLRTEGTQYYINSDRTLLLGSRCRSVACCRCRLWHVVLG